MKTKRRLKDRIDDMKQEIINTITDTYEYYTEEGQLLGTLYLKEKMDYGFHIYHIQADTEKAEGTLSELYYDLRHKDYWIKRNLKSVKFRKSNVDKMFPPSEAEIQKVFKFLSTDNNKGLYESAFQHLGAMGQERINFVGRFFFRLITEHNYFELLYKCGIMLTEKITIVDPEGKSPKDILGLTKTQWKMVSQYGVDVWKFYDIYTSDIQKADREAISLLHMVAQFEQEFGLDKMEDVVNREFDKIYGKYYWRSAVSTSERYNLPLSRFIRYIYFECDVSQGMNARTAISEYDDYIRMVTEMGYERFDKYPKFLKTYHDIAARNYQINLNEKDQEEWDRAYEKNKTFISTIGDYKFFPPEKPADLVREGNVLGHCVGSYVRKVQKGTSTILFMRYKDDENHPLITVELQEDKIVQARGKMNNPPTKEQELGLEKLAERFQLQLRY